MIKRTVKKNARGKDPSRLIAVLVLLLVLLGGTFVGLSYAFSALSRIWQEQCRVTDRDLDVIITSGKMVHPEVISYHFGLTNGANLATIPFEELRADLLGRIPNVRDLRIERRLPNRVTIDVVEREPIARITSRKGSPRVGRVADGEGVVFNYNAPTTTAQLPLVREPTDVLTLPGKRLTGMTAAALRLIEVATQPDLADLRVMEVDTSHADYLYVSLGNQDHAELAWAQMKDDTKESRLSLQRQLRHLKETIASSLTPPGTIWLATDWSPSSRFTASGPNNRAGN